MAFSKPTRRAFFQRLAAGSCARLPAFQQTTLEIHYEGHGDAIEVFRQGRKIQSVASANPSCLTLDTLRNRLFAVNNIDQYEGLPTGSVESYAVAPGTGMLALIGRRPLSLSATGPKGLAISPDGKHIVVAAYGGGAINVLAVEPDGKIGDITQVLKELGSGPHPEMQRTAHPHSVVFHPSRQFVIATDLGSDRIILFSFANGCLGRIQQIEAPPGSGPSRLRVSLNGQQVLVEHELQALRRCYQLTSLNGEARLVGRPIPGA